MEELSGSGYEIADGQPDIKGWTVLNSEGNSIGSITELLFNPQTRKVRYLIVNIDERVDGITPRLVPIPIGVAQLHEVNDTVTVPGITTEKLYGLPAYEAGNISPEMENTIRDVFAAPHTVPATGHDFYDHHHFSESNFYGKRWTFTKDNAAFPLHEQDPTEEEFDGDMGEPARIEPKGGE